MENIVAAGRQRRFVNGIILSLLTVGVVAALVVFSARPGWFPIVFVLAFLAALMFLQVRERT